jgi:hypothetical protein
MYIPKDYWMICDRCGGAYRKSGMAEEWTGLWVCTSGCFETRHPQDFVTGVDDDVSVPVARPDVEQTMGETTLASSSVAGDTVVHLTSVEGLAEKDPIGITLDDNTVHWSFIFEMPTSSGTVVFGGEQVTFGGDADVTFGGSGGNVYTTLGSYLPFAATSGNTVYLPSINSETFI